MNNTASSFAPVEALTGDPIRLAMQRLWLTGQVLSAGTRLIVQHVFQSDEERPLEAIYSFPLPRDAALRRFQIMGDGFEAHSELKQTEEAVRAYEQGIADGSLSALARQYGDGIVNLTVGNIRPKEKVTVTLEILAGVELRDDGFRFRFPFTMAPAYNAGMRVAVAGGDGEMELPGDEFGDVILPRFRRDASSLHEIGFELSVLHQLPIDEIGSPSHAIKVKQDGTRVALAPEKDVPNRDLVLDVRFRTDQAQVLAGPTGEGTRSFVIIAPSTLFGRSSGAPRRTVILLDRSGSMGGEPIAQAHKAIEACLAALAEEDMFGMVAFDTRVEPMHSTLVPATREQRERARVFLKQVNARGGTELAAGIQEAARVAGGPADIVVITDGQVFGTEKILAQARATGIRLFCLGIGSASQDRFLSLLARETGGVSRFVTARERVDLAAVDLFAAVGQPVASGLKVTGVQPEPPNAVFPGAPVLLFGEMGDDSGERVALTWDGGSMSFNVPPGDAETGEVARLLRGSRLIADWESRYPSEEAVARVEMRQQSRVAGRLLELSKTYGLASREMSLVAVVNRIGDRAGELPHTQVVPVGMPQDTSFSAYFRPRSALLLSPLLKGETLRRVVHSERGPGGTLFRFSKVKAPYIAESPAGNAGLLDLAALLEPDGGMPGDDLDVRMGRSIAAVFALVAAGHTVTTGALRLHLRRLVGFLKALKLVSDREKRLTETVLDAASSGEAPSGDWLALARDPGTQRKHIEAALARHDVARRS